MFGSASSLVCPAAPPQARGNSHHTFLHAVDHGQANTLVWASCSSLPTKTLSCGVVASPPWQDEEQGTSLLSDWNKYAGSALSAASEGLNATSSGFKLEEGFASGLSKLEGLGAGLGRSVSSLAANPSGLVDSLKVRHLSPWESGGNSTRVCGARATQADRALMSHHSENSTFH